MDVTFLDVFSKAQVQMQVRHRGLEIVVAKTVLDIGCREASGNHIDCAGMSKAVYGIDVLESLRRQSDGEVFSAKTIYPEAGEFLTALIDEEAMLIGRLWWGPESSEVELQELGGFGLQFYHTEAVALAQDGQGSVLGIEVVQVQSSHFSGSGAGIKKEMKEGIIAGAFFSFKIDGMKDVEDLIRVKEPDEGFLGSLLGDGEDGLRHCSVLRIEEADHCGEGFEGGEALIARSGPVAALGLEVIEEGEDELRGDLLQAQGFYFDAIIAGGKDQEEFEGVPVRLEGMVAHPLDVRQVMVEKLMDWGGQLHILPRCQAEKS